MAMTADGDSQDEAMAGSLGLSCERTLTTSLMAICRAPSTGAA